MPPLSVTRDMAYDLEGVRAAAEVFGLEVSNAEVEAFIKKAEEFESAARAVSVSEPEADTTASDVEPGDDPFNAFNYRCSLGSAEGLFADLRVG